MIKMVLCDIDGTLKPINRSRVTRRVVDAVHRLHDLGILFVPTTGRSENTIRGIFYDDELCTQTCILTNGKRVYLNGELVYSHSLDCAALERTLSLLRKTPGGALVVYPSEGDNGEDFTGVLCSDEAAEALSARMSEHVLPCDELPGNDIYTGVLCLLKTPLDQILEVRDGIAAQVPEFVFARGDDRFFDILPQGVSKASGFELLLERTGIALDEAVFFGDSENDLAMVNAVPNSVAVANAMPPCAEAARWHIGDCADDAVALALEQIADAAERGETPAFMCA